MTASERSAFAAEFEQLHNEMAGLRADVSAIKVEVAEWRGAVRLFRAASSFVGIGGLALILAALVNSVPR